MLEKAMSTIVNHEWVLLADRAHAEIYTRGHLNGAMLRYLELEHPAARKQQGDLAADRPGHGHGSASHHAYAYEDHANFPEQESEAFLDAVAQELNDAVAHKEIDSLILIALPKTMAMLKAGLNKATLAKISGEYAKNLIGVPEQTLPARLKKLQEKDDTQASNPDAQGR
ncbi:host attachment protein [Kordiimonas lipolytica]|uniref:Host attachment protein n=1 Tax=Kordiimonas lipolytica TaxID=1662421 RepID=A0ABV8U7T0_9PROT|nr:host attachment protein [Kordiimonas lipolytica]